MQGGIEEISCNRDVRFDEVSVVRQNSPRKFMLACIMVIRRRTTRRPLQLSTTNCSKVKERLTKSWSRLARGHVQRVRLGAMGGMYL